MIFELMINIFFGLADLLLSLLPDTTAIVNNTNSAMGVFDKLSFGIWVIGSGTWSVIVSSVLFWTSAHFTWAIIEWVYKKIPGVS